MKRRRGHTSQKLVQQSAGRSSQVRSGLPAAGVGIGHLGKWPALVPGTGRGRSQDEAVKQRHLGRIE